MTEFCKKTGDYATLSATDIKVLALTYQLEVEANGKEHLKTEPKIKKTVVVGPRPPGSENTEKVAGFYMPKQTEVDELANKVAETSIDSTRPTSNDEAVQKTTEAPEQQTTQESDQDDEEYSDVDSAEEGGEDEEEEDDDEDGWITPGNIDHVKKGMGGVLETVQLDVACLTTDFAMQVCSVCLTPL